VSVSYEGEAPKELTPPPPPAHPADGQRSLRLAPHGALGVELDLREVYPALRYSGIYRIEWRPLEPRLAAATAEIRVESRKEAILVTDRTGKLTFTLDYEGAPQNVANFMGLVRDGFYTGKTFHRIVPGFALQGGCPKGDGTGIRPDGKLVPAELRDVPVETGTLAMAHKDSDPNSASCQFFIALTRLPELDGKYTVIGRARDAESLRTLQELAETSTDRAYHPLAPLVIRSISLVDADERQVRQLEARAVPRGVGDRPPEKPPASQPAEP
jgi:peptidyl-prolyl cis-trans isomerase B (cyclophilin B)